MVRKIATACGPDLCELDYAPVADDMFAVPNVASHFALGHLFPAVMRLWGYIPVLSLLSAPFVFPKS